ncbi:glycosyltransferase [Sandaracinus amylolyticus]|uniref:glycosyltransferase n=1 Tax=Sandaracinus amylolyticus TaxID=927083 RepID=UPI001F4516A1|nr:glycosyltransferase [Sandaracinus amylolyticus]UJR80256.1 Glucuronosyltransferase [Sandaracinus amylolyticus]
MIFVTVGAQMPFDRMVKAVDEWAAARKRADVFAQIGPADYVPRHVKWTRFLEPDDFLARYREASVIVAHAGTGSILQALELGKPILVMPRRAALRETRNDHQVATAERFQSLGRVPVAWDATDLAQALDRIDGLSSEKTLGPYASTQLITRLRRFLDE